MIITKKEFVNIINKLQKVDDFVRKTNEEAKELDDAIISDFFNASSLSISHESIVFELLKKMFNDNDIISWWIYELDYGRYFKLGDLTDDGQDIDISTAEKLYDYLIKNMEGNK